MNQQSHYSIIVGPLVLVLGLAGGGIAVWLALNDPLALLIVVLFFFTCYKAIKWIVTPWNR